MVVMTRIGTERRALSQRLDGPDASASSQGLCGELPAGGVEAGRSGIPPEAPLPSGVELAQGSQPPRLWARADQASKLGRVSRSPDDQEIEAFLRHAATSVPPKIADWLEGPEQVRVAFDVDVVAQLEQFFETWLDLGAEALLALGRGERLSNTDSDTKAARVVKAVRSGDKKAHKMSKKQLKALTQLKRYADLLRMVYRIADVDAEIPRPLQRAVAALGELKDAAKAGERGRSEAKKVVKRFRALDIRAMQAEFNPRTQRELDQLMAALVDQTEELLSQDQILAPEYHQIRKNLRYLMDFLRLPQVAGQRGKHALRAFSYINSALGRVQDRLAEQDVAGDLDYGRKVVPVPEEMKGLVRAYLAKIAAPL